MIKNTCIRIIMSSIVYQDVIEANDSNVSSEGGESQTSWERHSVLWKEDFFYVRLKTSTRYTVFTHNKAYIWSNASHIYCTARWWALKWGGLTITIFLNIYIFFCFTHLLIFVAFYIYYKNIKLLRLLDFNEVIITKRETFFFYLLLWQFSLVGVFVVCSHLPIKQFHENCKQLWFGTKKRSTHLRSCRRRWI